MLVAARGTKHGVCLGPSSSRCCSAVVWLCLPPAVIRADFSRPEGAVRSSRAITGRGRIMSNQAIAASTLDFDRSGRSKRSEGSVPPGHNPLRRKSAIRSAEQCRCVAEPRPRSLGGAVEQCRLDTKPRRRATRMRALSPRSLPSFFYARLRHCLIAPIRFPSTPGMRDPIAINAASCFARAAEISRRRSRDRASFRGQDACRLSAIPPGRDATASGDGIGAASTAGRRCVKRAHRFHPNRAALRHFTIDMPGSGESPCSYGDPAADAAPRLARIIWRSGPDVDGTASRSGAGAFGAYWAARLAHVEAGRIKRSVFTGQYPLRPSREAGWCRLHTGGATYLFGPRTCSRRAVREWASRPCRFPEGPRRRCRCSTWASSTHPRRQSSDVNASSTTAPVEILSVMEHGSPKAALRLSARPPRWPSRPHARRRTPGHHRGVAEGSAGV